MDIDQNLKVQFSGDPNSKADVILCGHFNAEVLGQIEQAGVAITDRSHAEAGLITARLDNQGLTAIQSIAGLDSVSRDDMQYAL